MPVKTITVRSGAFTTKPAPDWLGRLNALAEETRNWDAAADEVLGDSDLVAEVQDHLSVAVQVNEWRTPEDGRYVEFSDVLRVMAQVWIPDRPTGYASTQATLCHSCVLMRRWRSRDSWIGSATA